MAEGCPVHHHGMTKARGCMHNRVGDFGRLFDEKTCARHEPSEEVVRALGDALFVVGRSTRTPGRRMQILEDRK